MSLWRDDVLKLSNFASSQPHAAYSAMNHGLSSCWTFLTRTVCDLSSFLTPAEEAIHLFLLPKLCLYPPNDSEQAMLALPIQLGGLGIFDCCKSAKDNYTTFQFHHVSLSLIHLPALIIFSNGSILSNKRLYLSSIRIFPTAFHLFTQPCLPVFSSL